MKNYPVNFADIIQQDLDDIWFFFAENSIEKADRTVNDLIEFCTTYFSAFPKMGRERKDLDKGLRYFPHKYEKNSYNIFYYIENEEVYIDRIFHGSKDYTKFF